MSSFAHEIIPVGETGDYINGIGFKESDWDGSGLPIIRIQNLTNEDKPFNFTSREVDEKYRIKNGDILVSWSATLDAFVWRRGPALLNQHIFKVVPRRNSIDPRFLFYQLKSIIYSMSRGEHAHGSTMKHINRKPFLAHPFWRPSLQEQQEIGQWLDAQFSGLDETERTLQAIQTKLKQARASILKAAVEGRLVEKQAEIEEGQAFQEIADILNKRQSLRPAKKKPLLDSESIKLSHLAPHWAVVTIDQLCDVGTGATPRKGDLNFWKNGRIPWVTSSVCNQRFVDVAIDFVTDAALSETNLTLYPVGTLLLAMYGEGKTRGQHTMLRIAATTNQAMAALSTSCLEEPTVRWLRIFLESNYLDMRRKSSGGVQPNLNLSIVKSITLPFPPIAEQALIADEVERRFSVLDQVEATVNASLRRCGLLRQAILKRAFEGRLLPAPPEPTAPPTLP